MPISPQSKEWSFADLLSAALMLAGLVLLGTCFTQL